MKSVLYISQRDVLTDHKLDVCYDAGIKSTLCRTCFKFIGRDLDSMFALGLNLTTAAYKKQTNNHVLGCVFKQ